MTPREALLKACDIATSQQKLAALIGLRSQGTIQGWLSVGRVPAERVLQIESATGVSRHDLRPDLYPRARGKAGRSSVVA